MISETIGQALMMNTDCNSAVAYMVANDIKADALVIDPPYSSGGQYRGDRAQKTSVKYQSSGTEKSYPEFYGDARAQRSFTLWCELWARLALQVLKPGSPVLSFIDWRQLPALSDGLQAAGLVWRGVAVWDKSEAARPQLGRFRNQAEFIWWGSHGEWVKHTSKALPGVFRVTVESEAKHHVTGKPVQLMAKLLEITKPGGVVLDLFAGSGSTGVAAVQAGRRFVGCEIQPAIYEIACQRLTEAQSAPLVNQMTDQAALAF